MFVVDGLVVDDPRLVRLNLTLTSKRRLQDVNSLHNQKTTSNKNLSILMCALRTYGCYEVGVSFCNIPFGR